MLAPESRPYYFDLIRFHILRVEDCSLLGVDPRAFPSYPSCTQQPASAGFEAGSCAALPTSQEDREHAILREQWRLDGEADCLAAIVRADASALNAFLDALPVSAPLGPVAGGEFPTVGTHQATPSIARLEEFLAPSVPRLGPSPLPSDEGNSVHLGTFHSWPSKSSCTENAGDILRARWTVECELLAARTGVVSGQASRGNIFQQYASPILFPRIEESEDPPSAGPARDDGLDIGVGDDLSLSPPPTWQVAQGPSTQNAPARSEMSFHHAVRADLDVLLTLAAAALRRALLAATRGQESRHTSAGSSLSNDTTTTQPSTRPSVELRACGWDNGLTVPPSTLRTLLPMCDPFLVLLRFLNRSRAVAAAALAARPGSVDPPAGPIADYEAVGQRIAHYRVATLREVAESVCGRLATGSQRRLQTLTTATPSVR
eukprot:TRINITY_DN32519_c0_g1_i1.p1 TRINITY_DN32519_c0_g1~~TRINITY_DN32519_c0_g1_i1.p1  ORF type:complete len:432 (+),score=24.51 TRINITY_DN32519_c0_g1_i1:129-1424(+)